MIGRTHWQTVVAVALVSGALTYAVSQWWISRGGQPLPISPAVAVALLGFAALLFALGRSVRRFVLGKRGPMDPLHAFRVFVLAKASALAGAAQLGFFAGQALVVLDGGDAPGARAQAWTDAAAAGACLVLVGVALLVEWFCRVPPVETDEQGRGEVAA
jgi:hypothetical protein